jgi:hypothetical protein
MARLARLLRTTCFWTSGPSGWAETITGGFALAHLWLRAFLLCCLMSGICEQETHKPALQCPSRPSTTTSAGRGGYEGEDEGSLLLFGFQSKIHDFESRSSRPSSLLSCSSHSSVHDKNTL